MDDTEQKPKQEHEPATPSQTTVEDQNADGAANAAEVKEQASDEQPSKTLVTNFDKEEHAKEHSKESSKDSLSDSDDSSSSSSSSGKKDDKAPAKDPEHISDKEPAKEFEKDENNEPKKEILKPESTEEPVDNTEQAEKDPTQNADQEGSSSLPDTIGKDTEPTKDSPIDDKEPAEDAKNVEDKPEKSPQASDKPEEKEPGNNPHEESSSSSNSSESDKQQTKDSQIDDKEPVDDAKNEKNEPERDSQQNDEPEEKESVKKSEEGSSSLSDSSESDKQQTKDSQSDDKEPVDDVKNEKNEPEKDSHPNDKPEEEPVKKSKEESSSLLGGSENDNDKPTKDSQISDKEPINDYKNVEKGPEKDSQSNDKAEEKEPDQSSETKENVDGVPSKLNADSSNEIQKEDSSSTEVEVIPVKNGDKTSNSSPLSAASSSSSSSSSHKNSAVKPVSLTKSDKVSSNNSQNKAEEGESLASNVTKEPTTKTKEISRDIKQEKKAKREKRNLVTKSSFSGFGRAPGKSSQADKDLKRDFKLIISLVQLSLNESHSMLVAIDGVVIQSDMKKFPKLNKFISLVKACKECSAHALDSFTVIDQTVKDLSSSLDLKDILFRVSDLFANKKTNQWLKTMFQEIVSLLKLANEDKNVSAQLVLFTSPSALEKKVRDLSGGHLLRIQDSKHDQMFDEHTGEIIIPGFIDYYDVFMLTFSLIQGMSAWVNTNKSRMPEINKLDADLKGLSNVILTFNKDFLENHRITFFKVIHCGLKQSSSELKPYIAAFCSHGLLLYSYDKDEIKLEHYEKYKHCSSTVEPNAPLYNSKQFRVSWINYFAGIRNMLDKSDLRSKLSKMAANLASRPVKLTLKSVKTPFQLYLNSIRDVKYFTNIASYHLANKTLKKSSYEGVLKQVEYFVHQTMMIETQGQPLYLYVELHSAIGFAADKKYVIQCETRAWGQFVSCSMPIEVEKDFGIKPVMFNTAFIDNSDKAFIYVQEKDAEGGQHIAFPLPIPNVTGPVTRYEIKLEDNDKKHSIKSYVTIVSMEEFRKENQSQAVGHTTVKKQRNSSIRLSQSTANNDSLLNYKLYLQFIDDQCDADMLYRTQAAASKTMKALAAGISGLFDSTLMMNYKASEIANGVLEWLSQSKIIQYSVISTFVEESNCVGADFGSIKQDFMSKLKPKGQEAFVILLCHLKFLLRTNKNLTVDDLCPALASSLLSDIPLEDPSAAQDILSGASKLLKSFLTDKDITVVSN